MSLLAPVYGRPVAQPSHDPLSELILTVLSQNTADTNSGRAFIQLLRRYATWQAITEAPPEEVVATIQFGGLAQQKAPRIQAILRAVQDRSPGPELALRTALRLRTRIDHQTILGAAAGGPSGAHLYTVIWTTLAVS